MDTTFHDNCSSAVNPLPFFNLIQPPVTLPLPSQGSALRAVMTSPGAVYLRDPQVCLCMWAKSIQLCPTLCDPIDGSPAGPSVHGTLQARILEWVAVPSSRRSFQLRDQAPVSCLLHWQADSSPPCPPTSGTTQSLSAMLTHSTEHSVLQGPRLLLSEFGALWADHPGSMLFFDLSGPQ